MKVVLDTNSFISCIGKRSAFRSVFDAFLNGHFILCVSTEILLEYEEKFSEFWGDDVTHNLLGVILTAENTHTQSVFYFFNLVQNDADDNKFADLFLAANADILVSNDRKLLSLNELDFPPVRVLTLENFAAFLARELK